MSFAIKCLSVESKISCFVSNSPWWAWPILIGSFLVFVFWAMKKRIEIKFKEECDANNSSYSQEGKETKYPEYSLRRKGFPGRKIGLYVRMPPGKRINLFVDFLEKYNVIFGMDLGAPIQGGGGRTKDWHYFPRIDFDDAKKKDSEF